ncbi:MAG: molybdopterin-dependent oxidoreductase [Gordonibacter pamelaeae]
MAFHFKDNPAPKKTVLEDGTEVIRTCAWSPPGCHAVGCGIRLFVKDGELVKVEGDPDHQLTQGRLCPRCLALKEAVYHPDRIRYPMKRAREDRGLDKWERISWDEATDLIVSKTEDIRARTARRLSACTWARAARPCATASRSRRRCCARPTTATPSPAGPAWARAKRP